MIKFVTSDIELDLASYRPSITEDNHWFGEGFYSKYSFPIDIELSPELDRLFGFPMDHNSTEVVRYVEGQLYRGDKVEDAVLELERVTDKCSFLLRFGIEQLPSAGLKLAQLPLDVIQLGATKIKDFAEANIDTVYPTNNFCFPMIRIHSINTEDDMWIHFEGYLNYRDGAIVGNTYDAQNDEQVNSNIIQPLPHILHVLRAGFEQFGATVSGSVFDLEELEDTYLFHLSEYYRTNTGENIEVTATVDDNIVGSARVESHRWNKYELFSQNLGPGRYLIAGNIIMNAMFPRISMYIGTDRFYHKQQGTVGNVRLYSYYVDEIFEVPDGASLPVRFFAEQTPYHEIDGNRITDATWLDVTISQVAYFENGSLIPALIDPDVVDLTRCVPDMTFGQFLSILKKWLAIDLVQIDRLTYEINLVKDAIEVPDIVDLTKFDPRYPERESRESNSFYLSHADSDGENYDRQTLLIDRNGISTQVEEAPDESERVDIELAPLPVYTDRGRQTAGELTGQNTLHLVRYAGLSNGSNTVAAFPYTLSDTYEKFLKALIELQIYGVNYKWSFVCWNSDIEKLTEKSRVAAFNRLHTVERLVTRALDNSMTAVELETISRIE